MKDIFDLHEQVETKMSDCYRQLYPQWQVWCGEVRLRRETGREAAPLQVRAEGDELLDSQGVHLPHPGPPVRFLRLNLTVPMSGRTATIPRGSWTSSGLSLLIPPWSAAAHWATAPMRSARTRATGRPSTRRYLSTPFADPRRRMRRRLDGAHTLKPPLALWSAHSFGALNSRFQTRIHLGGSIPFGGAVKICGRPRLFPPVKVGHCRRFNCCPPRVAKYIKGA